MRFELKCTNDHRHTSNECAIKSEKITKRSKPFVFKMGCPISSRSSILILMTIQYIIP